MREYHDDQTMTKVYDALRDAGFMNAEIENAVLALQNAGILFRERAPEYAYEYRLRADLPTGFAQPTTTYGTFAEAAASRDRARLHRASMGDAPQSPLTAAAFEALGNGWIERHLLDDWERVEES